MNLYYEVHTGYFQREYRLYDGCNMDGVECLRDCIGRPILFELAGFPHASRYFREAARIDEFGEVFATR